MLEPPQPPPHASLLQELLLALAGHTGDVFVDDAAHTAAPDGVLPDPHRSTVHLAHDIDWINTSEGCGMLIRSRWSTHATHSRSVQPCMDSISSLPDVFAQHARRRLQRLHADLE